LRPGESPGPLYEPFHVGGNPLSIWAEIGRADLLPTDSPEGALTVPTVALIGVDIATGAATPRIDIAAPKLGSVELCLGVLADGVVLQRWTATTTELIIVDPHSGARRVVTSFPEQVYMTIPGARAAL
jgi:hypothetical protein